jgi:hypothetical protein
MLLNLRYEWRLKSIEKYAMDSLMGAGWERVSTVGLTGAYDGLHSVAQNCTFIVIKGLIRLRLAQDRTEKHRFSIPTATKTAINIPVRCHS